MPEERWPALPYDGWADTYATLHLWSQVVGKIAVAQAPPINHCWGVALQVGPRGLSTRPLPYGRRTFTVAFDFLDHQLIVDVDDGRTRRLRLEPMTVATFYQRAMALFGDLGMPVKVWPVSVELPTPVRLDRDEAHHSYDPTAAQRMWRVLVQMSRVLTDARCRFIGKCSPVHFFWGSFDLAVTRFSGRPAPPRDGPAFMREAYSHEVISHGFWPGSDAVPEPVLYAYAVPEPAGLKRAGIAPPAAYYHDGLGEFLLPYEAVRTATHPDGAIRAFVESTYEQAATLAHWDRAALERPAAWR